MEELLKEEEHVVHRAIITCLRKCPNSEDRKGLLLIMERIISSRTSKEFHFASEVYSVIDGSGGDVIIKFILDEIQNINMEHTVNMILIDTPVDETPISEMIRNDNDESYLNLRAIRLSDSSTDLSEENNIDFLNLCQSINEEINRSPEVYTAVNENNFPDNAIATIDLNLVLNNMNDELLNNHEDLPFQLVDDHEDLPFQLVDDHEHNILEFSTRIPSTLTNPPNLPLGCHSDSPTLGMIRPIGRLPPPPPDVSPCNILPPVPPQILSNMAPPPPPPLPGPPSTPLIPNNVNHLPQSQINSHSLKTLRQSSITSDTTTESPRQKTSSSDYTSFSRQSTQSSQGVDNNVKHRSSSSDEEWSVASKPELNKGDTVYQYKRVSQAQLECFIVNGNVKSSLKELGAFYSINPCTDTNYFTISISGRKEVVKQGISVLDKHIPKDDISYTTENITIALNPELKPSGYVYRMLKQMYPWANFSCKVNTNNNTLDYVVSGANDKVTQIVTLVKFMASLPEKKYGMLYKLHSSLTTSDELTDTLRGSASQITGQQNCHVVDCKAELCKFLFVPGLCGQECHYKLQRHLNILLRKLESTAAAQTKTETQPTEDVEDVPRRKLIMYSIDKMLEIRQVCTEPLEALRASTLPIKQFR